MAQENTKANIPGAGYPTEPRSGDAVIFTFRSTAPGFYIPIVEEGMPRFGKTPVKAGHPQITGG